MQRTRLAFTLVVIALATCLALPAAALAQPFATDKQLTFYFFLSTTRYTWHNPNVWQDRVVWMRQRQSPTVGDWDVEYRNLTTGEDRILSVSTADQLGPKISGNWVVWTDDRNGNQDIYAYDLTKTGAAGEHRLTSDIGNQDQPCISGTKVFWEDDRTPQPTIWMYDLATSTESQVTRAAGGQFQPAVYGNHLVYADERNANDDIYMMNLTTHVETRITDEPQFQGFPAVSADYIVWTDARASNTDIWMYDIAKGTERAVTSTNSISEGSPSVSGDYVTYTDSNDAIMGYDIRQGSSFAVGRGDPAYHESSSSIWGDHVVYGKTVGSNLDVIMLGTLRRPSVSAATAATVAFKAAPKITGSVSDAGLKLAGGFMKLEVSTNGGTAWAVIKSATATVSGTYSFTAPAITSRTWYRTVSDNNGLFSLFGLSHLSGVSSVLIVTPRASLSAPGAPTTPKHGVSFTSKSIIWPKHTAGSYACTIQCYRKESGTWKLRKTVTAKASYRSSTSSYYSASVKLPYAGSWRLRAYHPADSVNAATYSAYTNRTVK